MTDFTQAQKDSIGVLVDAKIKKAVGWSDSKMSKERETVLNYYQGDYPKRQSKGNSSFVSTDVYDAVEAMKAQLLETFASGQDIIKFVPQNEEDCQEALIATEYASYVVFRQNNGYEVMSAAIQDGLMARAGVTKVYWDDCSEISEEEFSGIDRASVEGLAAQEDVTDLEAILDEATGAYSGKLSRKVPKGQVRLEQVPPEEFSVEAQAKGLNKETFCCHRTLKTVAELKSMGFDKKLIKKIVWGNETQLSNSSEVLARHNQMDDGFRFGASSSGDDDPDVKRVIVYEAYLPINFDDFDKPDQYCKVVRAGDVTLDIQEVDDNPFVVFVPLPIPHAFYGTNFAGRVVPTQNARTILTRSILDHSAITNTPRYTVLKGGLTNPRELLDNRLGGIVNITRPDAVQPMLQAPLNPFVFQTLELLKAQAEETTGISSLSQGMNKEAVSTQNSADLVENLVSLSQTRQKIIARNFANGYLIPLFLKVYDLVVKNEKQEKIIELTGSYVPVSPYKWKERKDVYTALTLGYGEQEKEAKKYLTLLQMAKSDHQIGKMMGPKGLFNAVTTVLKLSNIKNTSDFITSLEKLPPDKPDEVKVAELEIEDKKATAQMITAQAHQAKVETTSQIEMLKIQMKKMQDQFLNLMAQHENERKDIDIANKVDVAQREIILEEEAPVADRNTIVSAR